MDSDNKNGGIIGASNRIIQQAKDGSLFKNVGENVTTMGTGAAPNADAIASPEIDRTTELEAIANGEDPELVRQRLANENAKAQIYNPQLYENARTESLIYTGREVSEQEFKTIRERNAAAVKEQERLERKAKTKHMMLLSLIGVAILAFVAVLVLLIVSLIGAIRPAPAPPTNPGESGEIVYGDVGSYHCKTNVCGKITDLPDGRTLIRDQQYLAYDEKKNEANIMLIDEDTYSSVNAFKWGNVQLLVLRSNKSGAKIFNVDENRYVIKDSFSSVIIDPEDAAYANMKDIIGDYIIAKREGYRVIRISSGKEVLLGVNGVYMRGGFYVNYNGDDQRVIYNQNGEQQLDGYIAKPADHLYTKDNVLVVFADGQYAYATCYNTSSPQQDPENQVCNELNQLEEGQREERVKNDSSFVPVPERR